MVGKARNGIHFEHPRLIGMVQPKINACQAAGPQCGTGIFRDEFNLLHQLFGQIGLEQITRRVIFVFCLPVKKFTIRFDFDGGKRLSADQPDGPFGPFHHRFQDTKHIKLEAEFESLGQAIGCMNNRDSQTRTLRIGFDDQWIADLGRCLCDPFQIIVIVNQ